MVNSAAPQFTLLRPALVKKVRPRPLPNYLFFNNSRLVNIKKNVVLGVVWPAYRTYVVIKMIEKY